MLIKKYRKKPVVIEAVQVPVYSPNNATEYVDTCIAIAEWCGGTSHMMETGDTPNHILIKTLEGEMMARVGDFIIKGVKGEFYPCKPDIFQATYEQAPQSQLNLKTPKLHPTIQPKDDDE